MKVYLVEDCGNSPGKIYAIFASEADALLHALSLDAATQVVPRTLFYGQPPNPGYNP